MLFLQINFDSFKQINFVNKLDMQSSKDIASKITLIQYSNKFAQHYSTLKNTDTLYVIVGNANSGKSVFIDLLSGKQLIAYEEPERQITVVVQQNNREHEYHPLHIKKLNQSLSIQSFTLYQEELTPSGLQNMKLIFLQQFLKICSKVAFIVLVEQSYKQYIPNFLEGLLNNLGITSNQKDESVQKLKEYIYLLITKTEQDGQLQDTKQMLKELSSQMQNENIKIIINYLVEQDLIDQFRVKTPENDYADYIKNKFKLTKFDNNFFDILNKSTRRVERPFLETDQKQLINHLGQISKFITSLILFASTEEKPYQRQYETLAKALYPDNKKKNQISSMIGKWNKSSLGKIKNLKKISTLKKIEEKFQVYSQCLIEILKTLQQANEDKTQFKQIEGKIVFFTALSRWFSQAVFNSQIKQMIEHFANAIVKAQSAQKPKIQAQNQAKPKAKPSGKKNAANIFKESIQKCRNNGEAIQRCLSVIRQKEKEEKYDYFQVIFYIKLVRDLLQEFGSPNLSQSHIFIKELLQISLYTDNYYDFENYLKSALRSKVLRVNQAQKLLKTLYDTNKYQYCEKIVDYLIAECKNSEQFQKFAQFKVSLKIKINEQYKNRQKQSESKGKIEGQKKKITFSFDDLVNKTQKISNLRVYFEGKNFENHIVFKQ